jgi:WD40 repeat protein
MQQAPVSDPVVTRNGEPERPSAPCRSLKGDYWIHHLHWSRDGRTLAAVMADAIRDECNVQTKTMGVRLWDVPSGTVNRTLADDDARKCSWSQAGVALSPAGKTVAAAKAGIFDEDKEFRATSSSSLVLWDPETGKLKHRLKHTLIVQSFAFSPDGKAVATATGGNVHREFETLLLWDVQMGQLRRTLETTDKMAAKVAFAPDGTRLAAVLQAGASLAEVIVWDAAEGRRSQTLPGSEGISALAFSPDGKTLLGAARDKLRVWDVAAPKIIQASDIKTDFSGQGQECYSAFAFSPDGKTVAISGRQGDRHVVTLWDVKRAQRWKTLEGHVGLIYALAFSPDGKMLASGGEDRTIRLWNIGQGNPLKK